MILDLAAHENVPVYVVITIRSDYIGRCDAFYGLPQALNRSEYLVPRLYRKRRGARQLSAPYSFSLARLPLASSIEFLMTWETKRISSL